LTTARNASGALSTYLLAAAAFFPPMPVVRDKTAGELEYCPNELLRRFVKAKHAALR
jgi:hypothetical protein